MLLEYYLLLQLTVLGLSLRLAEGMLKLVRLFYLSFVQLSDQYTVLQLSFILLVFIFLFVFLTALLFLGGRDQYSLWLNFSSIKKPLFLFFGFSLFVVVLQPLKVMFVLVECYVRLVTYRILAESLLYNTKQTTC